MAIYTRLDKFIYIIKTIKNHRKGRPEVRFSPDCSRYPWLPMRLWRLGASESRDSRNLTRLSRCSRG